MNEQNRKIKQTNSMLGNALFELLGEKALQDITVAEVVNRSSVSKSTFYNHYKSPVELFERLGNDSIKGFNNAFAAMKTNVRKGFGMLVAIIKLDKERNKYFFSYQPYVNLLIDRIRNTLIENGENPLISEYKSNGMVYSLVKWVNSNYEDKIEMIGGIL